MVRRIAFTVAAMFATAGCGSSLEIDVKLVNPCDKDALAEVAFLRFEPRGMNIDSAAFARVEPIASGATQIPVVPAPDFQLVVTGLKDSFDGPTAAAGVSGQYDLVKAKSPVKISVPLAVLDDFYKTTKLDDDSVALRSTGGIAVQDQTCSAMAIARYGATATYLPQSGKVLVIGGATVGTDGTLDYKRTVEAYDPSTGAFTPVAELPFGGQRAFHTATLLSDGRILIAGGEARIENTRNSLKSALLVDARDFANVSIASTAALRDERSGHIAVRLADGRVLIAGGRKLNPAAGQAIDHTYHSTVEIYDPARGLFVVPGGQGTMDQKRYGHTGTLLKSGTDIFIGGGFNEMGPVTRPEVIRVAMNDITTVTASAASSVGPIYMAAGLADDGRVLLSGGYGAINDAEPTGGLPQHASANVEMWEFRADNRLVSTTCSAQLTGGRGFHSVTMAGRRAIFIGGRDPTGATTKSAEVATLTTGASCFATMPVVRQMASDRAQHAVVTLGSGEILVIGGLSQAVAQPLWVSIVGTEIFSPAREL